MTDSIHKTVLLQETIDGLLASPKRSEGGNEKLVVVDATFGGGGHSVEICKRYKGIKIIALDQDKSAFAKAKSKFKGLDCDITFVNSNFRDLDKVAYSVDAIMFDLGLSSDQLENSGRGFSFFKNEPLLMTMKANPNREDLTAQDIVNTWSEKSLADIIYGYGEEKFSRRIARGIVEARKRSKIKTTFDLVKIIEESVPARFAKASARRAIYQRGKIHYATRTFQAIRIAVNDELGALSLGLEKGFNALRAGGRMAVISFHSLEDRITKRFFKDKEKQGTARLLNKKPIVAGKEELKNNPRARSAKLRIIQKI